MPDLASRFLNEHPFQSTSTFPVLSSKLEAVDASLAQGRWLLIVLPDRVLPPIEIAMEIHRLMGSEAITGTEAEPIEVTAARFAGNGDKQGHLPPSKPVIVLPANPSANARSDVLALRKDSWDPPSAVENALWEIVHPVPV